MNVTGSKTFSSSVDEKAYVINHSFNCNDKFNLLTCNKCKMQYEGKAGDDFRLRWNNYKDINRKHLKKEVRMQQHLFEHFSTEGHSGFFNDSFIIFVDIADTKDPNEQEHCWQHTVEKMALQALNVDDD